MIAWKNDVGSPGFEPGNFAVPTPNGGCQGDVITTRP